MESSEVVDSSKSMSIDSTVLEIINTAEEGVLSLSEIVKKYNITIYRFYKIMNEYNIKTSLKTGPKKATGPKKTKFKQLLYGTEEEQKAAKILPEQFVLEDFITDSKSGMKVMLLMEKYHLTLYQIRELRKKYDLKTQ